MKISRQFYTWADKAFADDVDKIDVEAHYDSTLTVQENIGAFKLKFPLYFSNAERSRYNDQGTLQTKTVDSSAALGNGLGFITSANIGVAVVVGGRGSGKTALCHVICDNYMMAGKDIYVFRHPNQQLIDAIGYNRLSFFDTIMRLHDCVLWIDEPQLHLDLDNAAICRSFIGALSLARQRNIIVLISTCDTQFVTRRVEAQADAWFIKDIEPALIKQGSLAHNIIKQNSLIDVNGFQCAVNETLFYSRKLPNECGRHFFSLPEYWTEKHSKPYNLEGQ